MLRRSARWAHPTQCVHSLVNHCRPEPVLESFPEVIEVRAGVRPQIVDYDFALADFTRLNVTCSFGTAKRVGAGTVSPERPCVLQTVSNVSDDIRAVSVGNPLESKIHYRRQALQDAPEFGREASGPHDMHHNGPALIPLLHSFDWPSRTPNPLFLLAHRAYIRHVAEARPHISIDTQNPSRNPELLGVCPGPAELNLKRYISHWRPESEHPGLGQIPIRECQFGIEVAVVQSDTTLETGQPQALCLRNLQIAFVSSG